MNSRVFKFFHGHVITQSNLLVSHSLLKPSQVRFSFWRRFVGDLLGGWDEMVAVGLDGVAPARMDESKSSIWTDGYWEEAGGTTEPGLTTPDLDNPCFTFLWPWWLGRFPKSIVLDKVFLLSPAIGRGWDWVSGMVSHPPSPSPCFLS